MIVLVLGAGGMAGHVIATSLREAGFEVDTLSAHNALDKQTKLVNVLERDKLLSALDARPYDAVVNCIGLLIQQSEERKDLAAYVNGYLPHLLEQHFQNTKTK